MNQNTGHGHVFERPDGMVARCGGPGLYKECSVDQVRLDAQNKQLPGAVGSERLRAAVEAIYFAAHWTPDRECEAAKLWGELRDDAGIPPNQTAIRVGPRIESVGDKLVAVCRDFIKAQTVICAESTIEDRVYEHAPEFVEKIADIVGYYDHDTGEVAPRKRG